MLESISYSFFLGVALKSTAALVTAWITALLLHRNSAAFRHFVWSTALAALFVLPFLSLALPALHVPVADSLLPPDLVFRANASTSLQDPAWHAGRYTPVSSGLTDASPLLNWPLLLLLAWAGGAAVSLSQMCIGWAAVRRLRRTANQLKIPGFDSLAGSLGMKGEVDLFETAAGSMPMTYGLRRPAIFMPVDVTEWNPERRCAVLLHELAHVRRRDSATHLLARTALALYWWNPLAWMAWREFLKEREKAADDVVLGMGGCASDYANHLLEIARSLQSPAAFGWAAVAAARRSQLEGRLLAILDSSRNRKAPGRVAAIVVSIAAIGMIVPLAAMQARGNRTQAAFSLQSGGGAPGELIRNGDLEREQGRFDQAKALYGKALALSNSGSDAATAFLHLGTVELATKEIEQAIKDFERAQTADPAKAGEALLWTAIARERQNNLEAADASFQSALAAVDPASASAATIMEVYGQLLVQQGREDEADTMRNQAAEIRNAQGAQARSATPSSDVNRIGGEIKAPMLLSKTEPKYTAEGRLAKYQGTVLLSIEVGPDGLAHNIQVLRGLGFGLDQRAIEALSQWKFKPAMRYSDASYGGQPVTVAARVEVNFRLL